MVSVQAARGEEVLRKWSRPTQQPDGWAKSPWYRNSRSRCPEAFYNTLFDENAASHVALGSAYKFTLSGADEMSDEQFEQAGEPERHPRGFHDWVRRADVDAC